MSDELSKRPVHLTYFIFVINGLLDSKELRDLIGFNETRDEVERGNTVRFLQDKFGDHIDLSSFVGKLGDSFNKRMAELAVGLYDRESRKTGVENNGLCLLIAYATEIVQQLLGKNK